MHAQRTTEIAETQPTTSPTDPLTRLYISPLSSDNLSRIIPPGKHHLIESQSFHTLDSFPEKPYGYLTLPQSLAQILRKKYHGSILKGAKMKVEEARPERRKRKTGAEAEAEEAKAQEKEERRSKRKRGTKDEEGVLKGIEVPEGRKVKRGWSDTAGDKRQRDGERSSKKSRKADGDSQLVFRTSVPPNATPETTNGGETSKSEAKKSKRASKAGTLTEIIEREKTTKFPTFLRSEQAAKDGKSASTKGYVEGKGWIDADGNIVEEASKKRRTRATAQPQPTSPQSASSASSSAVSSSISSLSSASDAEAEGEAEAEAEAADTPQATTAATDATSTSPREPTPNISITSADAADQPQPSKEPSALEALFKRPSTTASSTASATASAPSRKAIATRSSTLKAPFAFFPSGTPTSDPTPSIDTSAANRLAPITSSSSSSTLASKRKPSTLQINPTPATPFSRRDLDARSLRSAAPTPDTAAIGRRFRPPWSGAEGREGSRDTPESIASQGRSSLGADAVAGVGEGDEVGADAGDMDVDGDAGADMDVGKVKTEEEEDDDDNSDDNSADPTDDLAEAHDGDEEPPATATVAGKEEGGGEQTQTEFEKHFYEHRGEYNRAWKARKREARKGARQSENRRGGGRVRG